MIRNAFVGINDFLRDVEILIRSENNSIEVLGSEHNGLVISCFYAEKR